MTTQSKRRAGKTGRRRLDNCRWKRDGVLDDNHYVTGCGKELYCEGCENDDPTSGGEYPFCPGCGRRIKLPIDGAGKRNEHTNSNTKGQHDQKHTDRTGKTPAPQSNP